MASEDGSEDQGRQWGQPAGTDRDSGVMAVSSPQSPRRKLISATGPPALCSSACHGHCTSSEHTPFLCRFKWTPEQIVLSGVYFWLSSLERLVKKAMPLCCGYRILSSYLSPASPRHEPPPAAPDLWASKTPSAWSPHSLTCPFCDLDPPQSPCLALIHSISAARITMHSIRIPRSPLRLSSSTSFYREQLWTTSRLLTKAVWWWQWFGRNPSSLMTAPRCHWWSTPVTDCWSLGGDGV